jgi:hypothetical protein
MTNFSETLIRCSAIGHIMTESRGKSNLEKYNDAVALLAEENVKYNAIANKESKSAFNKMVKIGKVEAEIAELEPVKDKYELSDTCKSYLVQAYVLSKYGRVMEVKTKQMVKGTISEEEAIDMFSVLEKRPYSKNTERIKNSWLSGTPDLFSGDHVLNSDEIIDIKSCWDIFTFLKNVQEPDNDLYYWQIQGYLALTGAKIGTIAYCLVNTPDSIVEGEKWNLLKRMDVATEEDPTFKKEFEILKANRIFDDIPMSERLLTYSVERNDEDIDKIYRRVELCREFLCEFEETHLKFSKKYRRSLHKAAI